MIPFQNLRSTHESFIKEYFRDLQQVFADCDFIGAGSKRVAKFETDFAAYIGSKHAISVASGTDALLLALDALGVKAGDEVIIPAFGFIATADVVVRLAAKPVFVDIDPATFNIDPAAVEAAITPRTRAIIPVHLYGLCADMAGIMEVAERHHLPVIEDVAQATGAELHGNKAGAIGTCGAFSFYPTKNLGGAGDGGMITTNDDKLAQVIRRFRDHGKNADGEFQSIGYNSRLDTIQAVYLHYKLPELDDNIVDRVENAKLYNQLFAESDVTVPAVPDDGSHTFNLYTIKVRDRSRVQAFLREKEIQSAIYYAVPMHLTPALSFLGYQKGQFPNSEEAARHVLSLPVWPGLKRKEIEKVVGTVNSFLDNNVALELRR
jgi:dTDP-4-amino-4,6-dideoxygalactose transaminase